MKNTAKWILGLILLLNIVGCAVVIHTNIGSGITTKRDYKGNTYFQREAYDTQVVPKRTMP